MESRFDLAGRIASGFPMSSPSDRSSTTRVFAAVIDRDTRDLDAVSDSMREQLAQEVGGFLSTRFGEDTTSSYIDWRKSGGYQLVPLEELKDKWFLDQTHEFLFGSSIPEGTDAETLYTSIADGMDKSRNGRHRIVGVSADPGGASAFAKVLSQSDPSWPALRGVVGDLLDTGSHISTSMSWWRGPVDYREKFTTGASLLVAQVGFLAEFGNGQKRPVSLSCVWDDRKKRWFIDSVHVGASLNDPGEGSSDAIRLEY